MTGKISGSLLSWLLIPLCCAAAPKPASEGVPFLEAELIFPLEHWHNHGSCIVECPKGNLLVCWYHGSGERTADDVAVLGACRPKGSRHWTSPFVMANTPGYPDTNPAMFVDPQNRLWLLWSVILANRWETAFLKYRISSDYQRAGPPHWGASEVLHVTPGTNFANAVNAALDALAAGPRPATKPGEFEGWIQENRKRAADKLSCRLGWMTRVHPYVLDGKRLIVPLYSDGFDFSLMALSDDWGKSWSTSAPLVGLGNVQPTIARRRDGTLVTFMRDNGPPPHRLQVSESTDRGQTWSDVVDSDRRDPGAGVEVTVLRDGLWLLIHNDLEKGRHSLAVSLSEDEGKTWKWTRHLERDSEADTKAGGGSYHYPSVIQAKDGTLHVSYSFHQKQSETQLDSAGKPANESIKHAHFNKAWIQEGDPR
jgi:predicted neuraminidase